VSGTRAVGDADAGAGSLFDGDPPREEGVEQATMTAPAAISVGARKRVRTSIGVLPLGKGGDLSLRNGASATRIDPRISLH
jgi:hypothetical protein